MRAMVAAVLWVVIQMSIAIFLDAIVGMKNVLKGCLIRLYGVILMKNVLLKNFEEI